MSRLSNKAADPPACCDIYDFPSDSDESDTLDLTKLRKATPLGPGLRRRTPIIPQPTVPSQITVAVSSSERSEPLAKAQPASSESTAKAGLKILKAPQDGRQLPASSPDGLASSPTVKVVAAQQAMKAGKLLQREVVVIDSSSDKSTRERSGHAPLSIKTPSTTRRLSSVTSEAHPASPSAVSSYRSDNVSLPDISDMQSSDAVPEQKESAEAPQLNTQLGLVDLFMNNTKAQKVTLPPRKWQYSPKKENASMGGGAGARSTPKSSNQGKQPLPAFAQPTLPSDLADSVHEYDLALYQNEVDAYRVINSTPGTNMQQQAAPVAYTQQSIDQDVSSVAQDKKQLVEQLAAKEERKISDTDKERGKAPSWKQHRPVEGELELQDGGCKLPEATITQPTTEQGATKAPGQRKKAARKKKTKKHDVLDPSTWKQWEKESWQEGLEIERKWKERQEAYDREQEAFRKKAEEDRRAARRRDKAERRKERARTRPQRQADRAAEKERERQEDIEMAKAMKYRQMWAEEGEKLRLIELEEWKKKYGLLKEEPQAREEENRTAKEEEIPKKCHSCKAEAIEEAPRQREMYQDLNEGWSTPQSQPESWHGDKSFEFLASSGKAASAPDDDGGMFTALDHPKSSSEAVIRSSPVITTSEMSSRKRSQPSSNPAIDSMPPSKRTKVASGTKGISSAEPTLQGSIRQIPPDAADRFSTWVELVDDKRREKERQDRERAKARAGTEAEAHEQQVNESIRKARNNANHLASETKRLRAARSNPKKSKKLPSPALDFEDEDGCARYIESDIEDESTGGDHPGTDSEGITMPPRKEEGDRANKGALNVVNQQIAESKPSTGTGVFKPVDKINQGKAKGGAEQIPPFKSPEDIDAYFDQKKEDRNRAQSSARQNYARASTSFASETKPELEETCATSPAVVSSKHTDSANSDSGAQHSIKNQTSESDDEDEDGEGDDDSSADAHEDMALDSLESAHHIEAPAATPPANHQRDEAGNRVISDRCKVDTKRRRSAMKRRRRTKYGKKEKQLQRHMSALEKRLRAMRARSA